MVSFSRPVAPPPLIPLTGAALTLNLCSNVPDAEIPDICASLMKTVGYKTYFVGEGQVLRSHPLHACATPYSLDWQVCSDLGFQEYGHWSLIDNNKPEVGVRCVRPLAAHLHQPKHFPQSGIRVRPAVLVRSAAIGKQQPALARSASNSLHLPAR